MTLLSEASFLVTPNGYKASRLYAAIPTNGNGDMAFTRATTATRVDENDLVSSVASNVPRIDYTGGGCPSILLEPQRTNLLTYSEQFDNAAWDAFISTTITPNTSTAPDGTLTADRLQGTLYNWYFAQTKTLTNGAVYTISMYVKSNTGSSQTFRLFACGSIASSNLTATNEWQRFSLTFTSTFANTHGIARNSSNSTNDLLVWGAQVEEGAYPTSYIPTTTATVTRNADVISKTGISDLINSEEGVLFVEMAATSFSSNFDVITLSDGTTNNIVGIFYFANSKTISVNVKQLGSSVFQFYASPITYPPLDFHKIAVKYKTGDFALWIDGTEVITGSGALTNLGLSNLQLADGDGTSNNFFGKVKQLQVYKTALTDTQLAALTT